MKQDEKDRIDANLIKGLAVHKANTLGGLIYQRIAHLLDELDQLGGHAGYDIEYEIRYLEFLNEIQQEEDVSGEIFELDHGIMYDMWAHIVCVANATRMMDSNFCPQIFAKGVYQHLSIMYYG